MTDEKYRHPERSVGSDIFNLSRVTCSESFRNRISNKRISFFDLQVKMKPAKYPCGSALGIVGFKKFFYLKNHGWFTAKGHF